ncbi:MAG: hypothetical protein ACR2JB_11600 [Bryobacteraceae bacterium]
MYERKSSPNRAQVARRAGQQLPRAFSLAGFDLLLLPMRAMDVVGTASIEAPYPKPIRTMRFEITSDNHILTIPEALPQEAGVLLGVADALVSHVRRLERRHCCGASGSDTARDHAPYR